MTKFVLVVKKGVLLLLPRYKNCYNLLKIFLIFKDPMNLIDTDTKAKSLPRLIQSADQFIKIPCIIIRSFVVNSYKGFQSKYLAPTHHRSWWVMGGHASWWVMGLQNSSWWVMGGRWSILMGDGDCLVGGLVRSYETTQGLINYALMYHSRIQLY